MTVLVHAIWHEEASTLWLQAADAIRRTLKSNPVTGHIKVEIIAWQLTTRRMIEALEEDRPIKAAWLLSYVKRNIQVMLGTVVKTSLHALIDRRGMTIESIDTSTRLLESPSRRKHNHTMHDLVEGIHEARERLNIFTKPELKHKCHAKIIALQQEYNGKQDFFGAGRHMLGKPWLSSGYSCRTDHNGRLDWALIELDNDRIGSNRIPPEEAWPRPNSAPIVSGRLVKGIALYMDVTARLGVYKIGPQKDLSVVKYSSLSSGVLTTDDQRLELQISQ
ncbi:MAG: hypothetical protein Q9170_006638 [Blastenia crenularia]